LGTSNASNNSRSFYFIPLTDSVTKRTKAFIYCQQYNDSLFTYRTYDVDAILAANPNSDTTKQNKIIALGFTAYFERKINGSVQTEAFKNNKFSKVNIRITDAVGNMKTNSIKQVLIVPGPCTKTVLITIEHEVSYGYFEYEVVAIEVPCSGSGGGSEPIATVPPNLGGGGIINPPPPPLPNLPPAISNPPSTTPPPYVSNPPSTTPPPYVSTPPNSGSYPGYTPPSGSSGGSYSGTNPGGGYQYGPYLPPNYWDIWNPYDPNLFPWGNTLPNQPSPYLPSLNRLINMLGLNQTQIDWLNLQSTFTDELYSRLQAYTITNGLSDEIISATKALIDAMMNGDVGIPFSAQSFATIAPYLTTDVLAIGDASVFSKYFTNQQWLIAFNNPSLQPWEVYWQALKNTIDEFSLDGADNSDLSTFDQGKQDKRTFQPFNFATQQIPIIPKVIPKTDFVPYRKVYDPVKNKYVGVNCMTLAKEQIAKNNCIMTNGYDPGNQTFALRSNPIKPTSNNSSRGTEQYNETETLKAISYMIDALNHGIPVIAGVDTRDGAKPDENTDNVTNHFIVIVGTSVDSKGRVCFNFYDSGTANVNEGTKDDLRIVFIPGVGLVAAWGSNPDYDPNWKVTQIRRCVKN
jgi:hypothetical protein